ncbi:hypothetical protein EIN_175550 [Entamoeba invadens IP1]|uniref:hypothetical protein n=1 Tax=Entamoeba invadens IP1 TaxID=370355 RepID=UPI0002C3D340|nr:hypothetical protein EIN_175550 [Entamoeba invadens IP1]ELP93768.1 hypothetical protein EIN_175550 [Entamoeba invadens IP1]|eukprot:XP_004260539.1 hypothetical protein EIN_175550 [Entamoeba invadens IP1]
MTQMDDFEMVSDKDEKKSENKDELALKVAIIGDLGVGKTTVINRYVEYTGPVRELQSKSFIFERRKVKLTFQDTCGSEQMSFVTSAFYQNAVTCIFLYDVSNKDSFARLNMWFDELVRYGPNKGIIPTVLCGNKCELEDKIDKEAKDAFLAKHPMKEYKISTVTGQGIDQLFNDILPGAIGEAIRQLKSQKKPIPPEIKEKGGCCSIQ